jgi:hypothetical protein
MQDLLKHIGKILGQGILWVFILSINWEGKSLYSYSHDLFVDNSMVRAIDAELAEVWFKLVKTAKVTFAEPISDEINM